MLKIVLAPVPGRLLRVLLLRVLLLRLDLLEPDDRLAAIIGRDGSMVRLSRRSSSLSLELSTNQTVDLIGSSLRAAAGGGVTATNELSEPDCGSALEARLVCSSEDHSEDTVDRCGFQRPDANCGLQRPDGGPGVKSRSPTTDVVARELVDDGARIRGY